MNSTAYNEDNLPDLLPLYYNRLFPVKELYNWLTYGQPNLFPNREISLTLIGDIYIRYQSFLNAEEFVQTLVKKFPIKIDIGAIYQQNPSKRVPSSVLRPIRREFVFDIDLTDYDNIRTCCQGAGVCTKCWKFMAIACKILDVGLRDDFGFDNILWVFSGRRGIHCWVADEVACRMDDGQRSAVADYFDVIKGGSKNVSLSAHGDAIPYSITRAVSIIDNYFLDAIVVEQNILGSEKGLECFLELIDPEIRKPFKVAMEKCESSSERWKKFEETFTNLQQKGQISRKWQHLKEEIRLHYAYPRIDINVTKSSNHLLKSPFCVHPKSGKVSVPFSPRLVDNFNPSTVPTISHLVHEINEYDAKTQEQHKEFAEGEDSAKCIKIKDYKKTSLLKYVNIFNDFLWNLRKSEQSDQSMEF